MRIKILILLSILSLINQNRSFAQTGKGSTFIIEVSDKTNGEKLIGATITYYKGSLKKGTITNTDGIAILQNLPQEVSLEISYIGYLSKTYFFKTKKNKRLTVSLEPNNQILDEVIVTATESKGITSTSKIDQQAMKHLQPSSFTDILSLLPGGSTSDPHMGISNSIRLREAKSVNKDYEFSSLGTSFIIDGVPLTNDANLQSIGGSSKIRGRFNVASGIDMRCISTDNIKSVEIIRGVPSVQYGDVSMGVVKIKRKDTTSPLHFRFKADQYSKLFYVGKGIKLGDRRILNVNLDYFDSKIDPRNKYENFKRLTTSIRYNQTHILASGARLNWVSSLDYAGTFDNIKSDPEVDEKLDRYKMQDRRISLNNELKYSTNNKKGLRNLSFTPAVNMQINSLKQTKEVYLNMPSAVPNSKIEGSYDAQYLPMHYISHAKVDGRPLNLFLKANSDWYAQIKKSEHKIKIGVDFRYEKNYGEGRVYNPSRPPSPRMTTRPRKFKDIPGLQKASFYIENNITIPFSKTKVIDIQAGLRGIALVNMNSKYALNNKIHLDPRLNIMLDIINRTINESNMRWRVGGGWGILTKLPTLSQLYPNLSYTDIEELNYFHNNPDYRRLVLRTHIYNPTNYQLKANRNNKWEIRTDFKWKKYAASITYFREFTNSGFRSMSDYRFLAYRRYNTAGIDHTQITDQPQLENLPYTDETYISTSGYVGNGSELKKQGVEFSLSTPRFKAINTRITLFGAWFRTTYNNSLPYWDGSHAIVNDREIPYLGLYDWNEKKAYQTMDTSLMFDTHIPKLDLIFSTTIQANWINKSIIEPRNIVPTHYVGKDEVVHPYTDVEAKDPILRHLILKEHARLDSSIPFYSTINFKANKALGKHLNIALFVNKLLSYTPSYMRGNVRIYRSVSPYFGMEINIKL